MNAAARLAQQAIADADRLRSLDRCLSPGYVQAVALASIAASLCPTVPSTSDEPADLEPVSSSVLGDDDSDDGPTFSLEEADAAAALILQAAQSVQDSCSKPWRDALAAAAAMAAAYGIT